MIYDRFIYTRLSREAIKRLWRPNHQYKNNLQKQFKDLLHKKYIFHI